MTPQTDQTNQQRGAGSAPTFPPPSVTLTPPGSAWARLINDHAAARADEPRAAVFRAELGLPADKPVVMSGHQAQWWHAGILAKQIALAVACTQVNGTGAWIVVDQDASDSLKLLYPAHPQASSPAPLPTRAHWQIGPEASAAQLRADVAIAGLSPFTPSQPPTDAATPEAARALRAIADSGARWAHVSSASEQIARANAELCSTLLGEPGAPILLFATRLSRTTAMRELLEKMAADPAACVTAYNRAVAETAAGGAGIAPLSCNPEKGRFELPLWQLSGKGKPSPRKRVFAHTLGDAPLDTLAPRGLMMTALLRWLGCDLFIHGLGGGATGEEGGYDKVTERWFKLWLNVDLAPSVVATATVLLPFNDSARLLSEEDLRDAYRSRHQARHTPRALNDATAQGEKDRLVAAIAATTDRAERHRLYRDLQSHLERYRAAHASDLSTLTAAAATTAAELDRQSVLRERTWPWPLIPRPLLLQLQRTVAAQLKG